MRTDIENLENGQIITIHPGPGNPLHSKPVKASFSHGYFYCAGTKPADGPDYYWADFLLYNEGFTIDE